MTSPDSIAGTSGWNLADVWEAVAGEIPDATALLHGDRRVTWAEFDRRADGLAAALVDAGALRQDKVALLLHNRPEYIETVFATAKASLVPVNTNYRYGAEELIYLWDNADAVGVVFEARFTTVVSGIRRRLPRVRSWLWVDDGSGACPDWATPYETCAGATGVRSPAPWPRSGDDLVFLYTGGTTGAPKGVMWRQDDLYVILNGLAPEPHPETPDLALVRRLVRPGRVVVLPAAPLMHGAALFSCLPMLSAGGTVVTLTGRSFDAAELLDTVDRCGVTAVAWVGDVFTRPVLRALDEQPGGWDLSSLRCIISSGVMWSEECKQGLMRHLPEVVLIDAYGSSEAPGVGLSITRGGRATRTARFRLGDRTRVIDEHGHDVGAGSGSIGRVALGGRQPLGYYKDPEKTAATFTTIDGQRYVITGDHATVETDGSITLLGRGSMCINTGGEKVFCEEVEEVLKRHPAVGDVAIVGVPDETFGEVVTAVVESAGGATIDATTLISHTRAHLAGYKAPRHVVVLESLGRSPNGKLDYARLRRIAVDRLAVTTEAPPPQTPTATPPR
jgi:3-oxocholest-4-en-26-oate---CoA ligase